MRILPASAWMVAFITWFCAVGSAFAQTPDVSGQWRTQRPSGRYDIVLTQNGSKVTGDVHLGSMQGTLNGSVLTGIYQDMMTRGRFEITFSSDGSRFQGGIQTQNGTEPWSGVRAGTLANTPEATMRTRARLDEVQNSGAPYEEQAQKACGNLFTSVYTQTNGDWVTSINVGPNPFAQTPGAPARTTKFAQIRDVKIMPTRSEPPPQGAAAANGLQYQGSVSLNGSMFRIFDGNAWGEWQDIRSFIFLCNYEVKKGTASISALDGVLGVSVEQLTRPTAIPPD